MKQCLFTILLAILSINGHAQVTYTPFIPGQSSSSSNYQSNVDLIRTTAYYLDSYSGQYVKVPVKVSITSNGYSTQIKIVEKYVSTGFGGQWQKVHNSGNAQACSPMIGSLGLGSDTLEQQFMYKVFVDTRYWYFDL